jgi:hypothetical protein
VKDDEIGRECSMLEEKRNTYKILMGNPERMKPLRGPRHRMNNNIKMGIEIRWVDMDWIDLSRDRIRVMNLQVP